MLKQLISSVSFILFITSVQAQQHSDINYLNLNPPPVDSVVVFARGIVSINGRWEEKTCFTPDGRDMFFGVNGDGGNSYFQPLVMKSVYDNKSWSNQFHISFKNREGRWSMPIPFSNYFKKKKGWDGRNSCEPYVSPDNKYFFFCRWGDIYSVKADFIEVLRREAQY